MTLRAKWLPLRRRKKPELESALEARCVKHAKARGWLARKLNGMGFAAWPDRLFLPPPNPTMHNRARFWVEFKRRGEQPTPLQARLHADLRRRGERVWVADSFERFVELFAAEHSD